MKNIIASLVIAGTALFTSSCQTAKTKTKCNALNWELPSDNKQAHVVTSQNLNFSAEDVWSLIAGFDTLPDYHASILTSKLKEGGTVRHITLSEAAGGGTVVERLVYLNDDQRIFSYKITDLINCDLAFRNYQARVQLTSTGKASCTLTWESCFDVEGASVEETKELARVIYQGCYDGISKVLAKKGN